jgi:hypothetical protein
LVVGEALASQTFDNVVNSRIGRSTDQYFATVPHFAQIVVLGRKETHQSGCFTSSRGTLEKDEASLADHHILDGLPLRGIVGLVQVGKDGLEDLAMRSQCSQFPFED